MNELINKRMIVTACVISAVITIIILGFAGMSSNNLKMTNDDKNPSPSVSEGAAPSTHSTATETPDRKMSADIINAITGQKWSNALNILNAKGFDVTNATILTNDGKMVIDPSNWSVESVKTISGITTINLHHDYDITNDTKDKISQYINE
jgi:hypothetical protein